MTDDLRARIRDAALGVRLHLGPNAIDIAQRGGSIRLSGNEADDVTDAVMAVLEGEFPRLLHEYADLIDAVDPQCTALVGPVWYGQGWHEAAHHLHDLADGHAGRTRRTDARGPADDVVMAVLAAPRAVVEFPAGTSAQEVSTWHAAWQELGGGPIELVAPNDCEHCYAEQDKHEPGSYVRLVDETQFGHDAVAHRLYRGLLMMGVTTGERVAAMTDDDVYDLRNSGRKAVERVRSRYPGPAAVAGGEGE